MGCGGIIGGIATACGLAMTVVFVGGEAALPSPGEKVAERSEVGCGMRAITLRKQSGIILADGKFSAGLCDVEDPAFFPAFHLSQLR